MKEKEKLTNTESNQEVLDNLQDLVNLGKMFEDFIASETEGMIVCENCLDTVFDDDEAICQAEDSDGIAHIFCCKECMDEWKNRG